MEMDKHCNKLLAFGPMTLTSFTSALLASLAIALTACATNDRASDAPKPRNGIAEYQQIAADAQKSLSTALKALDRVGAQTNRISASACREFSDQVGRLEAESVKIRARSQAMQSRGDAYFANWEENLARVKDRRVRDLARENHAALEQSFAKIKTASQQARQSFQPFLAGLHKLQIAFENDPGALASGPTRELVRATGESGRQVTVNLANIRDELNHMTAMLTPK
jgi:hypothetical protein